MKNMTTRDLVVASLFASLVFVGTYAIKLPLPSGFGYIHLGDAFVYLSGALLGPLLGGMAAGIGSMLADLLSGYAIYAPATFIIKAVNAVIVGTAFKMAIQTQDTLLKKMFVFLLSSGVAGVVMVGGYFAYEILLYEVEVASANVLFNVTQAVGSLIVATLLYAIFRNPQLDRLMK